MGVVVDHEVFGGVVGDFPEADDLAFGSGDREGAAESVDAFNVGGGAESGFAGGEGNEFGVGEVEVGDFEGGEDAVVVAAFAELESGEDESGDGGRKTEFSIS